MTRHPTPRARPTQTSIRLSTPVLVLVLLVLLVATLALGLMIDPASARADGVHPVGVWPLQPRPEVVHPFDPPATPYGPGHRGVDLAGRVGQPVHAAMAGTVSFVGMIAGRGVVVVDHGATRTTYQPVGSRRHRGEVVGRGGVIGSLDLVGSHCFPAACLHWGWVRGEEYLDPLALVGALPVRLLPWVGLPTTPSLGAASAPATMGSWRPPTPSTARPAAGPGGRAARSRPDTRAEGRWWLSPRAPPC